MKLVSICLLIALAFVPIVHASECATEEEFIGLVFPHFVNGEGSVSSITILNTSANDGIKYDAFGLSLFDSTGQPIHPSSVFDLPDGATIEGEEGDDEIFLVLGTHIYNLDQLTITTHGRGPLKVGYAAVTVWDEDICKEDLNGVLKFSVPGFGRASILANQISRSSEAFTGAHSDVLIPVRWHPGVADTGFALVNLQEDNQSFICTMNFLGGYSGWARRTIPAWGHRAMFVSELYSGLPTMDKEYLGAIRCRMEEGSFVAVGFEFDHRESVFTTLPVAPVSD